MTQTTESPISELRSRLRGEVVGADDPTYDDSRRDELDPVEAAYGPAKFARLVEIKAKYDPANMFHSSADIAPVG